MNLPFRFTENRVPHNTRYYLTHCIIYANGTRTYSDRYADFMILIDFYLYNIAYKYDIPKWPLLYNGLLEFYT